MITKIIKRDGRIVDFDKDKIVNAIFKAAQSVGGENKEIAENMANLVVLNLEKENTNKIPTVENIQDVVEKVLMENGYHSTAKSYILYRDLHNKTRNIKNLIDSNELIKNYLGKNSWEIKENSNQSYSLPGLNYSVATAITSNYWLNSIYDKEIRDAHLEGYLHIHNLGVLGVYCLGWNLEDLLIKGFGGVSYKNESKPPKHLRSALGQITNFFFTLQGEAAGAQAFSNFDTLLCGYIKKDNLCYEEVKQALQEFIFSINVPTRSGFQAPFTNITLDLKIPNKYREKNVIIGDGIADFKYKDCEKEIIMFDKALAEVLYEGDAKSKPFSVDGDCLCPINVAGELKLVKIGNYIDGLMNENAPSFIKENNCQVLDIKKLNVKCVGLKKGKIRWQRVNFVVRHSMDSLLKILLVGGYSIKTTPSHSVLVLKDGKIKNFEASKLKMGDYLITPKTIPIEKNRISALSLASEFVKRGKADGIYVSNVFKGKTPYRENRIKQCNNYPYQASIFPLKNIKNELNNLYLNSAKLSLASSNIKIPNHIPITKELVEFLGWYCAEGSAEKNSKYGGISLGLNLKKEKKQAIKISQLIQIIFGKIPVYLREVKERNLIEVRVHSKLVKKIITEIFEIQKGDKRKVPQIIFGLSPKMKKAFLFAYFKGDAWITDNIIATSCSRELIYGISTLLKQMGVFHTLTEYKREGRPYWRVNIYGNKELKNKDSYTISKIPLKESGLGEVVEKILEKEPYFYDSLKRKYRNSKNRIFKKFRISHQSSASLSNTKKIIKFAEKLRIEIPPLLKEIEENNVSFLKIKKIEEVPSSNGMVYDFSTESDNFVADQLLVHNTFPIPTINLTKDFNWGDDNLKEWWMLTAKYGTPYFANYIHSNLNPDDATSMCCRLRILHKGLPVKRGGLFASNPLTGSCGVVSIDLPLIAYESKGDKKLFFEKLDKYLGIAKESLEMKREIIEKMCENGLYPFIKVYLDGIHQINKKYFDNHYSTIGLIGMNEACLNFMGEDITTENGKKFGLEVLDFINDRIKKYSEETGHLFNSEATPAESAGVRFAKIIKKKYPDAITQGNNGTPYLTNSTHPPVYWTDDLFAYLKHQEEFQNRYTGGTVVHIYLGERIDDWKSCRGFVKKISNNFTLPYFSITPQFSICPKHGYQNGIIKYCSKCDEEKIIQGGG